MNSNFGILNINKPKGITSHDVVSRLRKILNMKQIGHTGTLDPIAQGVLPICIGKATRIIEYLSTNKSYKATAILGIGTNTYDLEGEIIYKKPTKVSKQEVEKALSNFEGEIEQTPPAFSAIKVKGKKLYEYARKGQDIEIPKRKIKITQIELIDFKEGEYPEIVFNVDCSGGTYIRSIIHDIGEELGCKAVMADLIRTGSGGFNIENSITLDEVDASNIINPLEALALPKLEINEAQLEEIKQGRYFHQTTDSGTVALEFRGQLVAIAISDEEKIQPKKVLL